jgi:amino acid transporter
MSEKGYGRESWGERFKSKVFGAPRDVNDPGVFHKIALIPFFAWIGLGADGLSSSAYGPEEAFRALGSRTYLAVFLGLATAITVLVISYTYTKIIERFPRGGGGYLVATSLLGKKAGLVSGSALIVDYILTITVSIASCTDAIFSYLPLEWQRFKVPVAMLLIILLIVVNIRGVKESITVLAPIFLVFLATHAFLLVYGISSNAGNAGATFARTTEGLKQDFSAIGLVGILSIFLRAYSLGGGTYTGIEAVSNGMQILREPKVHNGKRTMAYLAGSLAITAGGLFLCYLLTGVSLEPGRTLNASLASALYGGWGGAGFVLAIVTILSEGALLFVGSQAGFIDAPRVMANMAIDSWLPHRFADYSERLTMRNGIVLIGASAIALLLFTKGSVSALVTMYSINVFITFSLSEFAMVRHFIKNRKSEKIHVSSILIQLAGFLLCVTILGVTVSEKFGSGGWLTILITAFLIFLCSMVKRHYESVRKALRNLDILLDAAKQDTTVPTERPVNPNEMTAIQLVSGFNGLGVHTFMRIYSSFPGLYKNFVFVSVGVVDQELFKDGDTVANLKAQTDESVAKYVEIARKFGFAAEYRSAVGTSVVDTVTGLCMELANEFPRSTVFSGNLVFSREKFIHRLLHNETAYAIQRHLQWNGVTNVVLPIRVRP